MITLNYATRDWKLVNLNTGKDVEYKTEITIPGGLIFVDIDPTTGMFTIGHPTALQKKYLPCGQFGYAWMPL